jgi:hypothetical protein
VSIRRGDWKATGGYTLAGLGSNEDGFMYVREAVVCSLVKSPCRGMGMEVKNVMQESE